VAEPCPFNTTTRWKASRSLQKLSVRFAPRSKPCAVVVALTLTLVLVSARPGWAHANLESVSPAHDLVVETVPNRVEVRFDEPVRLDLGGGLRVVGPSGQRVDRARTALRDRARTLVIQLEDGGRGTYTVAWRVVSGDAHVITGSSVFHVDEQTGARSLNASRPVIEVANWFSRWLTFIGLTVLAGMLFVTEGARSKSNRTVRRLAITCAVVAAIGASGRFAIQVAEASGRSVLNSIGLWADAIRSTRAGSLDITRAVGSGVALLAALAWPRRWSKPIALAGSVVAMAANSLGGHAWTADQRSVTLIADLLHQGAAAVWIGGLVAMVAMARINTAIEPYQQVADRQEDQLAPTGWQRFSRLALKCVIVIVATGLWGAYVQVGSLAAVGSSPHGRLLVVKTTLFGVMIALGWLNRKRLRNAATTAITGRRVAIEIGLGVAVLAITASLTAAVPARASATRDPFYTRVEVPQLLVDVTVTPAQPGVNTMHLYFYDETGNPTDVVDAAVATIAFGDIPARPVDLVPISGDHYSAIGFALPQRGTWKLAVTTVRRGKSDSFTVEVPIK
jgi:copper transport protein